MKRTLLILGLVLSSTALNAQSWPKVVRDAGIKAD